MNSNTKGSCLCGNVTYEVSGELREPCICHCQQCRKTSGHYTAATATSKTNITINGDRLKWYKSSDTAERGFCQDCGSSLFWRPFHKNRISIFCGSIDGPSHLKTNSQICVEDKGDYYDLPNVKIIKQSELG